MTAYSYNRRFVNSIRLGLGLEQWPEYPPAVGPKLQTIRSLRRRKKDGRDMHAKPKGSLEHYTGMRTRQCRLLGRSICKDVANIRLRFGATASVVINEFVDVRDLDAFARKDGFANWDDLTEFWSVTHPRMDLFEGVLITWPKGDADGKTS